jgi:hypothetical protein
MKDLGKCRWQWRNRLERVSGGRGTRVSWGRSVEGAGAEE